jgi:hypothetical protein
VAELVLAIVYPSGFSAFSLPRTKVPPPPVTLETRTGCFNILEAMFAIALWLMSVPDPPPQPTQRLIGLEGKVSARVSLPTKMKEAIKNNVVKCTLFMQGSFLMGLYSGLQFTKKVYFVKLIYRIKKEWS